MRNVQTATEQKLVPLHIEVEEDFKKDVRRRALDEGVTVKAMTISALREYMSKPVKQASA